MTKMRAVQIPRAKGPFELVERDIPEPGPEQVRNKVQACGICHSNSYAKEGSFRESVTRECPVMRSPASLTRLVWA